MDSNTLRWRHGILSLCAVGFIFWSFSLFQANTWLGKIGLTDEPTSSPYQDAVVATKADWPAAKAGIKSGDIVNLRAASAPDRWRFRNATFVFGRTYTYIIFRNATERRITLQPIHYEQPTAGNAISLGWFVGALGALIFATIIAWRRPWLAEARLLCLLLIAQVITVALQPNNWITPWPALDFAATTIVWPPIKWFATFVLVAYTLLFGYPLSTLRKAIAAFTVLILSFDLLYNLTASVGNWSAAFDVDGGPIGASPLVNTWEPLALQIVMPLAIATAIAASRGRERSLLVWSTAGLFLRSVVLVAWLVAANVPMLASNETLDQVFRDIVPIGQFLTPFLIGYALLNRRLLDIGFVLNQAAIFSGVSIIVVGLFMLGEWVLGNWFSQVSHTTNLAISAALVVGLGFSVRAIHARVEHLLDRMFFRKRHDDEMAIRSFAEEASDATDAPTLERRTKETLETYADAAFVTLAMADGSGRYGDVSDSDPAIIALQGRHKALDLHTLATQLRGEFAYPMIAGGKLVGALVIGPKRSGESYAPDEAHAITQLAREVGGALYILTLAKALRDQRSPA